MTVGVLILLVILGIIAVWGVTALIFRYSIGYEWGEAIPMGFFVGLSIILIVFLIFLLTVLIIGNWGVPV